MRVTRWTKRFALAPVVVLALAACSSAGDADSDPTATDAETSEPEAAEETEETEETEPTEDPTEVVRGNADLVIWADDARAPALQPFTDDFSQQNDVEVLIQEVPFADIGDRLVTAGPAGEGPDVIIGPHDWLGQLVENGVVAPVDLTGIEDQLQEVAVQAFTYDGQVYGLPYATENVALFRNTDLVPEVPGSWEELESTALELQESGDVEQGIVWPTDPGDPYHNYPIVTAYGGYVFGMEDDGTYDPNDVGIDSEGAIEAAFKFGEMVESGLLSPDITYELMVQLFGDSGAAFAITGPWAAGDFADAPFEVTPIPSVNGNTPQPFVGVQGFMVSAFAENALLAQTFVTDFMATEEAQIALFEAGNRPPALVSAFEAVSDDPNIEGFGQAGANGVPMPAIPEMGSVWEAWINAYELIYEDAAAPDQAFQDAADQIRSLIE